MLKPEMKEHLGRCYRTALTMADIAFEYTRQFIRRVKAVDWLSYFHPSVYSTEGIERMASAGLDLFIGSSLMMLFPIAGQLVGLCYFLLRDSLPFLQGQSLGKHFFGLRVVKQFNLKPITRSYKCSSIRGGVLLVPGLNLYDIYIYMTTGQRWVDGKTETLVIKEKYNVQDSTGKET